MYEQKRIKLFIRDQRVTSTLSWSLTVEPPDDVLERADTLRIPLAQPLSPDEDSSTPAFRRSSAVKSITVEMMRNTSWRFLADGAEK